METLEKSTLYEKHLRRLEKFVPLKYGGVVVGGKNETSDYITIYTSTPVIEATDSGLIALAIKESDFFSSQGVDSGLEISIGFFR